MSRKQSGEQSGSIEPRRRRGEMSRMQGTSTLSPFSMMRRFADEMENMFGGFPFPDVRRFSPWKGMDQFSPEVDIFERDGKLVVRADLPGINPSDVTVEATGNAIVIEGQRNYEHEEEDEGVRVVERSYGHFRREIPLPDGADPESAKAELKNGVLEITLAAPKHSESRRKIEVQGEKQQNKKKDDEAA